MYAAGLYALPAYDNLMFPEVKSSKREGSTLLNMHGRFSFGWPSHHTCFQPSKESCMNEN